jgi:hypothetical protein
MLLVFYERHLESWKAAGWEILPREDVESLQMGWRRPAMNSPRSDWFGAVLVNFFLFIPLRISDSSFAKKYPNFCLYLLDRKYLFEKAT